MEMQSASVCRLCLAVDADKKMLSLTPVQELYEKVTNNRLHTNKMPVTVCYFCFAQLKRCYKFMVMSTIAENTLIKLLSTQTEITPESVCTINRDVKRLRNPLTVTPVKLENFPIKLNVPALVKRELIEQEEIDIKMEVIDDMTVSDAEDCGHDSEEDNVPLQCIKDDNPGSNTDNIPESSSDAQVSGDVEIEEGNQKGVPNGTEKLENKTTAIKPMQSLEPTIKHIKKHTAERSYECDVCHRKFKAKLYLIEHFRLHTDEKPFKCKICNRSFSARYSLVVHSRTHTGEKPFECEICNRSFGEKSNLVKHVRMHTGEKPFECEICNRCFKQKSNLVQHVRTHTGEKPFECEICNRSFSQKSSLKYHLTTHSSEKHAQAKQAMQLQ